ncbi:hypothetical protein ACFQZ2_12290 [Streptomonospora algeriensis]|uniref:Uncharacterized protein n=1 Tax=Streptomonospora algeriensis TaxID=995084 RepID=A0ABW3BFI7_9ACTN
MTRHQGQLRPDNELPSLLRVVCTCGYATSAHARESAARQDYDGHLTDMTPTPEQQFRVCADQPALPGLEAEVPR